MADRISAKDMSTVDDVSGESVDLIEITGVVKWFDVAKASASSFPTMACRMFFCM